MKKLLFSLALLGAITFWACSSNDDGPKDTNCVTCNRTTPTDDSFHLCSRDGKAVVDGVNTGGSYDTELANAQATGYTCQ